MQDKLKEKYDPTDTESLYFQVSIGGERTGVVGSNDDTALQIALKQKPSSSVGQNSKDPASGQYILDGVRGNAANFLFYKTTGEPTNTYITGTKNLSNGITFRPGQNVLTFSVDSAAHQYTFPTDTPCTADELIDWLNDKFSNGDDNGNTAPLKASLENGSLKLSHKVIGSHTITDIDGSARSALFLEERSRDYKEPIRLLVGADAKDTLDIPRIRIGACSLAINSIIINKTKYAEKAVRRIADAISKVSARRGLYGAMQNRLEHTIDNNNNVIENTQASESVIRDTDIAYQIMEQTKNNILMQASQSILAQANQSPNMVLNLLK